MSSDPSPQDDITYGIDPASPDGDATALSIKRGDKVFTFLGEEAEAVIYLLDTKVREAELRGRVKELTMVIEHLGHSVVRDYREGEVYSTRDRLKELTQEQTR